MRTRPRKKAGREEHSRPSHAEEEWYREDFLARHPEAVDAEARADRAAHEGGSHERAGNAVANRAAAAYGTFEHGAALEQQLVTAGVPARGGQGTHAGREDPEIPHDSRGRRQGCEGRQNPWSERHASAGAEQEPLTRPLTRHATGAPHSVGVRGSPSGQKSTWLGGHGDCGVLGHKGLQERLQTE